MYICTHIEIYIGTRLEYSQPTYILIVFVFCLTLKMHYSQPSADIVFSEVFFKSRGTKRWCN